MTALLGPIMVTDDTEARAAAPLRVVDVGLDTGNGRTHLTGDRPDGEGVLEYAMPSALALFNPTSAQILAMREAGPGEWGQFNADEHMVVFSGALTETAVGELALLIGIDKRYPVTTGSGDDDRYIDLGVKLGLTAIARAYAPLTSITARVCTGLPVALWSRERAEAVAAAWRKRHAITYKGTPVTITVTDVRVKAEGHAAWVTLPAEAKVGTTLLIDIGARTAIATLLYDGEVAKNVQAELGVDKVLDQLSAHLAAKGLRPLSLYERYGLLDALAKGAPYHITVNSRRERIDTPAATLFAAAGEQLIAYLATQFPFRNIDRTTASGGGSLFMGAAAQQTYAVRSGGGELQLLTDAERRTARGYYEQLSLKAAAKSRKGKGRR